MPKGAKKPLSEAGGSALRPLYVFNGGFLLQKRLRRILRLAGYRLCLGMPSRGDLVGVWGDSPTAHRGKSMAARQGADLVRVEDAFLRSLFPGRSGEPPLGLLIDRKGLHFDGTTPSDLEDLLRYEPLDDTVLLNRARAGIARMAAGHLSKYSATCLDTPPPDPGYVLVIDQTASDASVRASGADRARFLEMLTFARLEHPGQRFVIKTHPETQVGYRSGHFRSSDCGPGIEIFDGACSPWTLLNGAIAVYTVSSQMGFEAILAGHKPRVFGTPFYAGWGLTQDEVHLPRRNRTLSRAQLFAAAMILYPVWYDPYRDQLCELEDVLDALEAMTRGWRDDRNGWIAVAMRLWKRQPLQKFFGKYKRLQFQDDVDKARAVAAAQNTPIMAWAGKAPYLAARVEDGFLRSRGLGAELVPPLSLVVDRSGIYYDPAQSCDLEKHIQRNALSLRPDQVDRVERLISSILGGQLTKYNLSGTLPPLPKGKLILVPGQVEDDASILKGCGALRTNADLLKETRRRNPDATLVWKPHPDVEAGLRQGHVDKPGEYADFTLAHSDMGALLDAVDEVWTMTSLTGFEALLRGRRVTCFGTPFFAGWGLTQDLGEVPQRRLSGPRPDLNALVHAALIDYPRYLDPVTGLDCPVEIIVHRLTHNQIPKRAPFNRSLSKLQGLFASQAHLWRR